VCAILKLREVLMPELTPLQSQVLAGLLAGGSIAAVAREHKVHRSTIYNWRYDHPAFTHALRDARQRQAVALHDAALDLSACAYGTLGALLRSECELTRLRSAQAILRVAGASGAGGSAAAEPTSGVDAMAARMRRVGAIQCVAPTDRPLLESPLAAEKYPDQVATLPCPAHSRPFNTIRQITTSQQLSSVEPDATPTAAAA
jgi:transposase-like protein